MQNPKNKKKRQPERLINLTQKRLTLFLQNKYIYPTSLGHTVNVLFYSVLIFIMTRILIDGDPDPDALFISIMMLIFLNVFGSLFICYLLFVICYLLYVLIPEYRTQEAEMRKLTGVMAGTGGGYSSGSDGGSYSSSSGGSSGSSGSSGGGGGSSGGGGASGSW